MIQYTRKNTLTLIVWSTIFVYSTSECIASICVENSINTVPTKFWLLAILPITFLVSIDYSLNDSGIEAGSWLLRAVGFRNGRIGMIKWSQINLVELFPGEIAFFPIAPLGHLTTYLYTDSWSFLEEICTRVENSGNTAASSKLRERIRNKSHATGVSKY